ncbi:hypothetical protein GALL_528960 [mine drainage metagenome]|uniref:Uncharacterized protein n=1 Tax=mine drainage metagenome TaxID=410659 RepID=A0A1J5P4A8_9ZZZZ
MTDEASEVLAFAVETLPADPASFVILAIDVVVAVLGVADFIAGQNERHSLRKQQAGELVFPQLTTKRRDRRVIGRTFMSAIVAVVVVGAVAVVLAIGLVVFCVVAEQIGKREAIMDGDVIDAGAGTAAVVVEQIGRAGHAAGDFADQAAFAAPVAAHRAAVAVIPFRPLRRKGADLIAAHAEVPGLGDELDGSEHRVLADRGKKGGVAVKAVRPARQRRGEVEPEAVDVTDLDPIAQ